MERIEEHEPQDQQTPSKPKFEIAQPYGLSPRAEWLRSYFFLGTKREWNNEYMPFTTGEVWDEVYNPMDYFIVPETHTFMGIQEKGSFTLSLRMMAHPLDLPEGFWNLSLPERRAVFSEEAMLNGIPQEIISSNDLIAGGRFNTQLSKCLTQKETKEFMKRFEIARHKAQRFHQCGFGNCGPTGGHLIANYERIVKEGFSSVYNQIQEKLETLTSKEKKGPKGDELRAMLRSAEIPRKLAMKYAEECQRILTDGQDTLTEERKEELRVMIQNLEQVPWNPAKTFWQGIQAVWFAHMLIIAEESYPGAGVSFGRLDQYLWELYKQDVIEKKIISKEFAKDILSSFFFHCNTVYDAQIRIGGNQGITSGFGQLVTLSGCGPNDEDLTNELTYTILEVVDEWYPSLEPKPNIRLHAKSPERLLDVIVDMVGRAQGAPFLLNFDERSMAGLVLEGLDPKEVWDYACVGCLENSMQGNDRSGTVNCNPNLAKSIELTLWNGKSMPTNLRSKELDELLGPKENEQFGPTTGDPETFTTWDEFWNAWKEQIAYQIRLMVDTYNYAEQVRADFLPTPYVSILVNGCIENAIDIRQGGPELRFITAEGVGFATTVDSLLAIKHLVFEPSESTKPSKAQPRHYSIEEIKQALLDNFQQKDHKILQQIALNRVMKYGNDIKDADKMAQDVMKVWCDEVWKYSTPTDYQFRPGMLSWNYWAGADAGKTVATPNGRNGHTFLSNAICPSNGADVKGPTAVTNSVGTALGGKTPTGEYINLLPNGASHTITFNPSILRDEEHREKFKAYLRGYIQNGGTALQINMLDADMLRDAQKHPELYKNLLVRVTGYNAYFHAIGRELQDEIIARETHQL